MEKLTDKEIETAFTGTNFGESGKTIEGKKRLIAECLLKLNCNYHDGHTITQICKELGLIRKNLTLNKKGKEYMFRHFIDLK
jgi:hypothetical protein